MKHKESKEFKKFDRLVTGLLRVPHLEIAEKLKKEKEEKRKSPKHSSASRVVTDRA